MHTSFILGLYRSRRSLAVKLVDMNMTPMGCGSYTKGAHSRHIIMSSVSTTCVLCLGFHICEIQLRESVTCSALL